MESVLGIVTQVLLAIALPYFVVTTLVGIRVARREAGSLRGQEAGAYDDPEHIDPGNHRVYVLVPCLDEERVIGATVERLVRDPVCRVVVINDGSRDGTAAAALDAAAAAGAQDRVQVLTRALPDAQQGKGAALNAALPAVVNDAAARGTDPGDVIVAVMDADGRLSPGGLRAPLRCFDDPGIGGVQLTVRIRNRGKLICRFQDVEFWSISALSQFARTLSGTVSLGGNGQFTRLSALLSLPGDPWTDSLTEDLDLGVRLVAAGWRTTTTGAAYVDQQAVESYRRLLRQRTRWYQGHLTCIRRLPELWRSPKVSQVSLLEVSSYLLVPWLIVLPWSVVQQLILFEIIAGSGQGVFAADLGSVQARVTYAALWYGLSFLPNILVGLTYSRRTGAVSLWQALALGHLMIAWNYIGYLASWRACVRMIRGRTGWEKTARSHEPGSQGAVPPQRTPAAATHG